MFSSLIKLDAQLTQRGRILESKIKKCLALRAVVRSITNLDPNYPGPQNEHSFPFQDSCSLGKACLNILLWQPTYHIPITSFNLGIWCSNSFLVALLAIFFFFWHTPNFKVQDNFFFLHKILNKMKKYAHGNYKYYNHFICIQFVIHTQEN